MSIHSSSCVKLFSGNVPCCLITYYILLCLTLDYFTHQGKNTSLSKIVLNAGYFDFMKLL